MYNHVIWREKPGAKVQVGITYIDALMSPSVYFLNERRSLNALFLKEKLLLTNSHTGLVQQAEVHTKRPRNV